jgi:hypothetical protein
MPLSDPSGSGQYNSGDGPETGYEGDDINKNVTNTSQMSSMRIKVTKEQARTEESPLTASHREELNELDHWSNFSGSSVGNVVNAPSQPNTPSQLVTQLSNQQPQPVTSATSHITIASYPDKSLGPVLANVVGDESSFLTPMNFLFNKHRDRKHPSVVLKSIQESADRLKGHKLSECKQRDRWGWGYSCVIKDISTEYITPVGCRWATLIGRGIIGYVPINRGAGMHHIENRNCPNGLMPVLALVLMMLSDYELSFKDAHLLICAFAREKNIKNEKQGSANVQWLNLWVNTDANKADTADIIFGGRSKNTLP